MSTWTTLVLNWLIKSLILEREMKPFQRGSRVRSVDVVNGKYEGEVKSLISSSREQILLVSIAVP